MEEAVLHNARIANLDGFTIVAMNVKCSRANTEHLFTIQALPVCTSSIRKLTLKHGPAPNFTKAKHGLRAKSQFTPTTKTGSTTRVNFGCQVFASEPIAGRNVLILTPPAKTTGRIGHEKQRVNKAMLSLSLHSTESHGQYSTESSANKVQKVWLPKIY